MRFDRYQNVIDNTVGYARGAILGGPADEYRRAQHAAGLLRKRIDAGGMTSICNFTGHQCRFPISSRDLVEYADETIGPARFFPRLERLGISHLEARPEDRAAVFNRTSAGIIATESALTSAGERWFRELSRTPP